MFSIQVSEDLIKYCEKCLEIRNFGKRTEANGSKEQQLTGIIGQSVVMDLFGLGYVNPYEGFDNGVDLEYSGFTIDVKTMGRSTKPRPEFTNNFIKFQDDFDTDIYIFCSLDKIENALTVCGWIGKDEFKLRRNEYKKGTIRKRNDGTTFELKTDSFEINNNQLNDVHSDLDLKLQIIKKFQKNLYQSIAY